MALGGMLVALEVASFGCLAAGNLPRPVNDGIYVLMAAACAVGARVAWKRRGWMRVAGLAIHLFAAIVAILFWFVFTGSD